MLSNEGRVLASEVPPGLAVWSVGTGFGFRQRLKKPDLTGGAGGAGEVGSVEVGESVGPAASVEVAERVLSECGTGALR